MAISRPRTFIRRAAAETLDDYVERVLLSVRYPVCISTVSVLTGLAPHRVCKILTRLERDKKIRKITNVYHAYWQAA